jgi:hypothetical protein
MGGFSRRISQSGKPPPSFSALPDGFITLVVAKKCTAQIAYLNNPLLSFF